MSENVEDPKDNWMLLMDAVTSTGVGEDFALRGAAKEFTVQAVDTGLTSGILDLEGSIDGVNWFQLASHTFTAAEVAADQAMFHVTGKGVSYIRPNLTAYSGTALTVKAIALPSTRAR